MKVLFLSHNFYPEVGGIEINSEILANGFIREGHQVRMLTWTKEKGERAFSFDISRNPTFIDLYKAHRWADIVFENNPCLRLSWPNLFIKRPLVVALRTWISRTDGQIHWQDNLKTNWLRRAARVIAVSEAIRKRNWPKATVIGNPYREEIFKKLPCVIRSRDMVFLGRLVSDKGANLAIEALSTLCSEVHNGNSCASLNLTIIGEGPEKTKLEKLAKHLGVADRVTFTGKLQGEDLVWCLNQHKVILIPSIWEEPFGNVALEGMACGCIPIVSDGGGLPDAVGNAGLVFESGNVKALTACIKSILHNSTTEKKLKINATSHLLKHGPEKIAKEYLSVINEALKQQNP